MTLVHALTIDVEDWYHDSRLEDTARLEQRVEANTLQLIDLLAEYDARATFFFLGEVAQQRPSLARRVREAGHEVGSHGYRHRRVGEYTRREFRDDVERSLRTIEDATGVAVRGYRAPYFSIKAGVRWPVEILAECGLLYDASVLAIDRPPGLELVCPRTPFALPCGLWEVPVAMLRVGPFWHLPLASGAGLRLLPRRLLDRFIRRFESDVGAGVFYLHPWELDVDQPRLNGKRSSQLRQYTNLHKTEPRLRRLLQEFRFAPIREAITGEHPRVRLAAS